MVEITVVALAATAPADTIPAPHRTRRNAGDAAVPPAEPVPSGPGDRPTRVRADGDGIACADRAIDAAFAAIGRIHHAMSPQWPSSDLARFNAAAAGAVIACDPWTLDVLAAARELALASDGVFDPTLGRGGLAAWSLAGGALHKHRDEAILDLGGIAKGDAVDRGCAALQAQGVSAGWINAGGDLRVFGALPLPVHVRSADDAARCRPLVELRDGAFATSHFAAGSAAHRVVGVAAPLCRWADALTKVCAYAPPVGRRLLPRYHAQVWFDPV